jgi:hypothetical protein
MPRALLWPLPILLLTGCTRLDAIPAAPPQTAATWLTIQPYSAIRIASQEIILIQPGDAGPRTHEQLTEAGRFHGLRVPDHVFAAK